MAEKGYICPIKKKIPLIPLLNLFGNISISHFLSNVKMFVKICRIFGETRARDLDKNDFSRSRLLGGPGL